MWGGGESRKSEKGLCFRHIKTESLLDVQSGDVKKVTGYEGLEFKVEDRAKRQEGDSHQDEPDGQLWRPGEVPLYSESKKSNKDVEEAALCHTSET